MLKQHMFHFAILQKSIVLPNKGISSLIINMSISVQISSRFTISKKLKLLGKASKFQATHKVAAVQT